MDFSEVIRERRSIRNYSDKRVDRKVIEEIIEEASWAPSGGNLQPWNVAVLMGKSAEKFCEIFKDNIRELILPVIKNNIANAPDLLEKYNASDVNELSRIIYKDVLEMSNYPQAVIAVYHKKFSFRYFLAVVKNFLQFFFYRLSQKNKISLKISYIWFLISHTRNYYLAFKRMNVCSLSNFAYAITLSAYNKNLATCIHTSYALCQKKLIKYLDLGKSDEIVYIITMGYSEVYKRSGKDIFSTRRFVDSVWV